MHKLLCLCLTALALVCADDCPDGRACKESNTCCKNILSNSFDCCPFHHAVCCEDHIHCCPEQTLCLLNESRCVNATTSLSWEERVSTKPLDLLKSFRIIKSFSGEDDDDDKVCPDQSHCPAEYSCLEALRGYGCCPVDQGVSCNDGKHCCPKDHKCSADGSSCKKLKQPVVSAVRCSDKESECPDGSTCCETPDGTWGCCPMPKAVCCEDKIHCCPEGSTCDIKQLKCISTSTNKEMPMWAKSPARKRADWENRKVTQVTTPVHPASYEKLPTISTVKTNPFAANQSVTASPVTQAGSYSVQCDGTYACDEGTTCCKTKEGQWACCPLPKAVCCEDFIHCCPNGKKCNLVTQTCDTPSHSTPWLEKVPARPWNTPTVGNVSCDPSHSCPDKTTCCKTATAEWACCPLPQAVCCEDHEHCCPKDTTCDLATLSCNSASGSLSMVGKIPALTTRSPDSTDPSTRQQDLTTPHITEHAIEVFNGKEDGRIACDAQTTCPRQTTCCFLKSSKKWGCCPLPKAVCCSDGNHCCPFNYKCDTKTASCSKKEVVIPWYTKLAAESTGTGPSLNAVECDGQSRCPEGSSCCKLTIGKWGCCPLKEAVCCQDQEHCCPQGYRCNMGSGSCQRLIFLQLQTVPLTRVSQPEPPLPGALGQDVKCDGSFSCQDEETCCKTSATTWGCCPSPNAVCCSDMKHCCPTGYTCTEGGDCTQDTGLKWDYWQVYFSNKKRALTV